MFPFWGNCCGSESSSYQTHQERKLTFLKRMRDHMETRLAALNAAIESVERQMNQEESV